MEMTNPNLLASVDLEKLKEFDSCTISNAIERLGVRPRNEGFLSGVARCRFPKFSPMVGYAATARIRTASVPMSRRCYYDRMDWWNYVASLPEPRVMVLQDADHNAGLGAFVGEIHAAIGVALHCVGCITNGAVRDLPRVRRNRQRAVEVGFRGAVRDVGHLDDTFLEEIEISPNVDAKGQELLGG